MNLFVSLRTNFPLYRRPRQLATCDTLSLASSFAVHRMSLLNGMGNPHRAGLRLTCLDHTNHIGEVIRPNARRSG
jgi:hypothetical protein